MKINEYANLQTLLNAKLYERGRTEKFGITTRQADGEIYYFLTLKNPFFDELSIEMTYDGEWTVYFLGIHDHLYGDEFYGGNETFANAVLKRCIIPILENRIVHVCYAENGKWCGSEIVAIPENIPFEFTEDELPDAQTCRVLNWQGEVENLKIRAFAVSERKEVEELKALSYAELFE